MKKIAIALLGAGRIGAIHYQAIEQNPDAYIKYVYDPSPNDFIATKKYSQSLSQVLCDEEIRGCIIAAPSSSHVDLIKSCALHGKHVFCEKPVSFHEKEILELKKIVLKSQIICQVGFNRRFDDNFLRAREMIQNGEVGKPVLMKITNRDPLRPDLQFVKNSGGLIFDFHIHDFDMVRFITNEEIISVFAQGDALIDPNLKDFGDIDTSLITLQLRSQALVSINCSRETGYGYDQQLEVHGNKGSIGIKNIKKTSVKRKFESGILFDAIQTDFIERYKLSYERQMNHFVACLKGEIMPACTLDDALSAIKVAQMAQTSLLNERVVVA